MKKSILSLLLIVTIAIAGCEKSETEQTDSDSIIGTWNAISYYETEYPSGDKDGENPVAYDHAYTFREDGTFTRSWYIEGESLEVPIVYSGSFKLLTIEGVENLTITYVDPDSDDIVNSTYEITLENNRMTLVNWWNYNEPIAGISSIKVEEVFEKAD